MATTTDTLPPMTVVDSTAVFSIGWRPLAGSSRGSIFICWKDHRGHPTGTYEYPGATMFDWNQLVNASSHGQEANRVKRRYSAGARKVG